MRTWTWAAVAGCLLTALPAWAQNSIHGQPYYRNFPAPSEPGPSYRYTMSADGAVATWYQQYLGRAPEQSAITGWVSSLRRGTSPMVVQAQILGSNEAVTNAGSTPQGYVNWLFREVAGRPPTPQEVQYYGRMATQVGAPQAAYDLLQRNGGNIAMPPASPVWRR